MHTKDLGDPTNKDPMTARDSQVDVGDGKLPIPRIFRQLVHMKYSGCANLEYEIHDDAPMPGMIKSFAYMRGVLAGITVMESRA
jgi:sugar phosphate isomerase/epimerase